MSEMLNVSGSLKRQRTRFADDKAVPLHKGKKSKKDIRKHDFDTEGLSDVLDYINNHE